MFSPRVDAILVFTNSLIKIPGIQCGDLTMNAKQSPWMRSRTSPAISKQSVRPGLYSWNPIRDSNLCCANLRHQPVKSW